MFDETVLLSGRSDWEAFCDARERFLAALAQQSSNDQGRMTMGLEGFIEAWNRRDAAAVAAQFSPDGVRHQFALPEARLAGRDAIEQGVGVILHAVPDAQLTARSNDTDGNGRRTMEWVFSGTLLNDFPGLPANGQSITLPGVSVFTLNGDGAIVEERAYWDSATLMAAAGVLG